MSEEKEQDDLFNDQPETEVATKEVAEVEVKEPEVKAEGDENEEDKTGEEDTSGTPPEGKEGESDEADGKMIPEKRFKAALKQVTDERDAYKQKVQSYEAVDAPDKDSDPEGYDLHIRMEASKTIMREMVPDYDEVIAKYPEMAKINPFLDKAVAEAKNPAKFAYDLVKRSIEMDELKNLKGSDEWKEFQEYKKLKDSTKSSDENASAVGKTLVQGAAKVPNLNRATNVSNKKSEKSQDDEELFAGAL